MQIELGTTRERFIERACYTAGQLQKAADQDRVGLPNGQHIEAMRRELNWLLHKLPNDLESDIRAAIASGANETDKP